MMQAAPLITEELLDEDFFAELDALIDKDFEENKEIQGENRNCGTGAVGGKQGFQPGNKCAGSGETTKGKAEGKKKNVHSDWDDGKTAAEAGWEYWKSKSREYVPGVEPWERSRNRFIVKNSANDEEIDVRIVSSGSGEIHPRTLSFEVNGSQAVTGKGRGVAMKVIREVANRTTSLFQDDNVPGLIFTSDLEDGPGRAKLYKRMSEMLANKYDGISLAKPTLGGNLAFSVVKKSLWEEIKVKMADKTSNGYKWKKSKDLPVKKINDFFNPTDGLDFYDGDDVDEQWDQIPDNTGIYYRFMEVPDQVEKTYFFDELLNDESFMQEIERMFDSIESRNCGTGAVGGKQGFQPGNKCAGTGEKSKGKAEGKKKDVHSDWDDGSTAGRYWDYGKNKKSYRSTISIDDEYEGERKYQLFSDVSNSRAAKSLMEIHDLEKSPMYNFMFEDDEGETEITGKGSSQKVFREVVNRGLSLFDEPNVGSVTFTAARYEQSRVKLYDFLSRFAEKRRKNLVAFADNNDKYHIKFHVVDRKYADDFKEWYKFDDNPIYPVDTYEGEYGEL